MTLVLPLSVDVPVLHIADEEAGVELRCFLPSNVDSSVDVFSLEKRAPLKFDFDLRRNLNTREQKKAVADANLVCFLFVTRLNETGDACLTTAGCGRVPIGALLQGQQTISLTMPCIDYRTGALPKAVVRLSFRSPPQLGSERLTAFFTRNELVPTRALPPPHAFSNYIRKCEEFCMPSTFKDLTNIDMFTYDTVAGPFPAQVFIRVPSVYVDESFFIASAEHSARRLGLSRQQILALDEKTNKNDALLVTYWLATVFSIYSQYCHYVGDEVYLPFRKDGGIVFVKQEIDLFEYPPIHYGSGDCEDLSSMFLILSKALRKLKATDPLVIKLQTVQRAFIVALLLDGVTTGQINDSSKAGEETTSAHMSGCLLNRIHVQQWFGEQKLLRPENNNYILPYAPTITMLEGTGPLDPDKRKPEDADAAHNRKKLYDAVEGLENYVRQMYSCRDGKFYKKIKVLATDQISKSVALFYLTPDTQAKTAGVLFSSMADETLVKKIQLVPEAPLSAEEIKRIKYYKRDLHPVFPLLGPAPGRGEAEQIRQSRMQMASLAKKFSAVMRPPKEGEHAFCLLANYSNFDKSGQFIQLLSTAFAAFNTHTGGSFSWDEETVTTELGGWYLLFYSSNRWQ